MKKTLPKVIEETHLVEFSEGGRSFQLHPDALKAWEGMKTKAIRNGVQLRIVSAFRSVHHQAEIIDEKKKKGLSEKEIYKVSAPPGFSEHHSGRAIDISTPGYPSLEDVFEDFKLQQGNSQYGDCPFLYF